MPADKISGMSSSRSLSCRSSSPAVVFLLSVFSISAFIGCTGSSANTSSANASPAAMGKVYFNGYGCVKCHAVGGKGGTYGPDLTMVGFRKSAKWIDTWLKSPHKWRQKTVMPNFHLPDEVRDDVVAYLSAQKGQAWGPVRPWASLKGHPIKEGAEIYKLVGCVTCHGEGGLGGYPNNNVVGGLIPPLNTVAAGYTKNELINRIKNGLTSTPEDPTKPLPLLKMPEWGKELDKNELTAVADYLISLDPKAAAGASQSNF